MTEQRTERRTLDTDTDDSGVAHVWCCNDSSIGLCGTPLDGMADGSEVDCAVCDYFDNEGPYGFCPKGGTCRLATEAS